MHLTYFLSWPESVADAALNIGAALGCSFLASEDDGEVLRAVCGKLSWTIFPSPFVGETDMPVSVYEYLLEVDSDEARRLVNAAMELPQRLLASTALDDVVVADEFAVEIATYRRGVWYCPFSNNELAVKP